MDPNAREAWIKALTSGQYEQGMNTLRQQDSYCVLGVLCDVYMRQVQNPKSCWYQYEGGDYYFQPFCDHQFEVDESLPSQVSDWAALDDDFAVIPDPDVDKALEIVGQDFGEPWAEKEDKYRRRGLSLMRLNDAGVPFQTLAKVIEAIF